jgi:hypothetical protein
MMTYWWEQLVFDCQQLWMVGQLLKDKKLLSLN